MHAICRGRCSRVSFACVVVSAVAASASAAEPVAAPAISAIRVDRAAVELVGPRAVFTLLVDGLRDGAAPVDLTHRSTYSSADDRIVAFSPTGVLSARGNGATTVTVRAAERTAQVQVVVRDVDRPRTPDFEYDVVPILSRYGCNASGCHGKAEGQAGFKLSVFGFDPPADHRALTMEARGRRVFPAAPSRSLLVQKATGGVPHGGGARIAPGSDEAATLVDWIVAGVPLGDGTAPKVVSISVAPRERQLDLRSEQQLRIVATYDDGRVRDVTRHARFQSNAEGLATVDEHGRVTVGESPGVVAVMASYMGAVDVFRAFVPQQATIDAAAFVPPANFVDRLVQDQLRKLNVAPSGDATDAEFLRRASLDVIGTLPTPDEARRFLADSRPDRRARLIDELLERPEFADYQALQWADLLRVDRTALGHKEAYRYYAWIRSQFVQRVPLDRFATEAIAAEGLLSEAPAGNLYRTSRDPGELAATVSQVFLGIRIDCARCHHHPYDRWSQDDYFGMQGMFTQVAFKKTSRGDSLTASRVVSTVHPRTKAVVVPHPLGAAVPEATPDGDRRRLFAQWLVAPDNPFFARNVANRVWAKFFGHGLVDPVDDVRSTNPPSHPELLDALAKHLVDSGFDLRALVRTIVSSRTYQTSSRTNPLNAADERNFSRSLFRPIDAEVLLDAVCHVTGVPEKFEGLPDRVRAVQLWDSQVDHPFLKLFGRPTRSTPCTCERASSPSISQVLHVLNSPSLQGKLSHAGGRIADLLRKHPTDDAAIVEETYLACFSRYPDDAERTAALAFLKRHADDRTRAVEDLVWTQLNSVEFLFNH